MAPRIPRPADDEQLPYYLKYIAHVPGDDAWPVLLRAHDETPKWLAGVDEAKALHRYAPDKWSVKEVIGHLSDGERVFSYRALRFARADVTPLPGFEENEWVPAGRFDARPFPAIVDEFRAVRAATLALFDGLDAEALTRRGLANEASVSVRSLAWIVAGHELHHLGLLRERYGVGG